MNRIALLAALTVAIAGANFTAHAGGSKEDEAFQKRLFGRTLDTKPIHACFSRVYAAGHLAQHPRQNVRTMLLFVTGNSDSGNGPNYGLSMGVIFRKSGAQFESAGNCGSIRDTTDVGGSADVAHCGVDCDGGSIDVAIKDAKSVMVSIPEGARLWRAGSDEEVPGNTRRRFGADDKVKSDLGDVRGAGVELHACRHTMDAQKLTLGDLLPGFVVAEKGAVIKLAELQAQGWAYLRP